MRVTVTEARERMAQSTEPRPVREYRADGAIVRWLWGQWYFALGNKARHLSVESSALFAAVGVLLDPEGASAVYRFAGNGHRDVHGWRRDGHIDVLIEPARRDWGPMRAETRHLDREADPAKQLWASGPVELWQAMHDDNAQWLDEREWEQLPWGSREISVAAPALVSESLASALAAPRRA